MPEDEWEDVGDEYEKPFDAEWISKDDRQFKLYYKGMISAENLDGTFDHWDTPVGAGIAIYDLDDNLILKLRKQLGLDMSKAFAEYLALKEGLVAIFDLGIQNFIAHKDCFQVYNQVIGRWNVRQRKIVKFHQDVVDQVHKLDKLFMVLIPRLENIVALMHSRDYKRFHESHVKIVVDGGEEELHQATKQKIRMDQQKRRGQIYIQL